MTQKPTPVMFDEELHNNVVLRIEHVTGVDGHVAYKVLQNGEVKYEEVVKFKTNKRMGEAFRAAAHRQYQFGSQLADKD